MKEWKKVKLGDISEYVNSKIDIQKIDNNNYISTENMVADRGGIITASSLPNLKSVNSYKSHDILISNIRPYFKKIWLATFEGGCSTDVLNIRGNEYIYFKYLYYILSTDKFFDFSLASAKGTKMPRGDKSKIMDYPILLPPLAEQEAIAEVLSSLDDKIELNNKINKTLEEMAQAIFKNWFIDFEFPNENGLPYKSSGGEFIDSELGKIPKGWKVGMLSDIIQSMKTSVKSDEVDNMPYVPIDVIPMHSFSLSNYRPSKEAQSSLLAFNKNDILIGAMRVYFHRVVIAPFDGITRTTCFILRPIEKEYLEYALLLCNQGSTIEFAQNTSKGSTMPYAVWEGGLAQYIICVPETGVIQKFSKIMQPLISKLQNCIFENLTLSTLRDTLLPKLMSGEVRVMEGK